MDEKIKEHLRLEEKRTAAAGMIIPRTPQRRKKGKALHWENLKNAFVSVVVVVFVVVVVVVQ